MGRMHLLGALGALMVASGAVHAQGKGSRPPNNADAGREADWHAEALRLAKLEQHVADLQSRVAALENQIVNENIVNQNLEIQIGILTRDTRHQ